MKKIQWILNLLTIEFTNDFKYFAGRLVLRIWPPIGIILLLLEVSSAAVRPLDLKRIETLSKMDLNDQKRVGEFIGKYPDLGLVFVLGKADERFIAVNHAHWFLDLTYDDFARKDALGRMLCPGHPLNKFGKYLIIRRADATEDTLAHEFLHYLQAKRDEKQCGLYDRLEENPTSGDIAENYALEYEVARLLYEKRVELAHSTLSLAAQLEKLLFYRKQIPQLVQKIDVSYEWKALSDEALKGQLDEIVKLVGGQKIEGAYGQAAHAAVTEIKDSFSVLKDISVSVKDIPLCLDFAEKDSSLKKIVLRAVEVWNQAAKEIIKKEIFRLGCDKARIVVRLDEQLGAQGDGIFKFAYVDHGIANSGDSSLTQVVVRKKEFLDYENLLAAIVRKRRLANRTILKDDTALTKKLEEFKNFKLGSIFLHTIIHELGHVIGLGHNFNASEKSVMSYAEALELSTYDKEALAFQFTKKKASTNWQPSLKVSNSSTLSD